MNTDNADFGTLHIEKGVLTFTLHEQDGTHLDGHEIFKWDDPKTFAKKMAEFYRVPIHGAEQLNFKTVKP